jgi:hypothetical protein
MTAKCSAAAAKAGVAAAKTKAVAIKYFFIGRTPSREIRPSLHFNWWRASQEPMQHIVAARQNAFRL